MLSQLMYRIMYRLGQAHWDTGDVPAEISETLQDADFPDGPVLDLGCGTGTSVIYAARLGRQAIGIDFVPAVVAAARKKAAQAGVSKLTTFYAGDVTRLGELGLPRCSLALDMGCFHGLSPEGRRGYVDGLSGVMAPGGLLLMLVLKPRREMGVGFGLTPDQVRADFTRDFTIERVQPTDRWDQGSNWFWIRRC